MDMLPVNRGEAEQLRLGTDTLTVLASSASTSGNIFAVEIRMPPGGGAPVMHRHAASEIYLVTEGEFTFYLSDGAGEITRVLAGPGDTVPLAGSAPHSIRNESKRDAVAISVHSPGTAMEAFARAGAAMAASGDPAIGDVLTLAERHGVEMLGPVPPSG
jgi:mannose-6-phosphate isomerase-like protein (cupin superfamily)